MKQAMSLAAAALFSAAGLFSAGPGLAQQQACKPYTFEGHDYTLCEAPLNRYSIRLYWRRPSGAPYMHLSSLPKYKPSGRTA